MGISERMTDGVTILDLNDFTDGLDASEGPLQEEIDRLLDEGRTRFILNLGSVSYLDSARLGGIIVAFKTVRHAGGSLKLANATQRVHHVLSITKLLTVLDAFAAERDAVQSFS
jgi:anti-sigma B factor antagonist